MPRRPPRAADARSDRLGPLRALLALDLFLRLTLWVASAVGATGLLWATGLHPAGPPFSAGPLNLWMWANVLAGWLVLFNLLWVVQLLALGIVLPHPQEGEYPTPAGGPIHPQVLRAALRGALTRLRYQAPAPAFLVNHLCNLPPLCWPCARILGPRTQSCWFTDAQILDPHLLTIGRNVILGQGCMITGHTQMGDRLILRRTVIEDGVVVGGNAMIGAGVRIGTGAVIRAAAGVLPGSVIGPGEFWGGFPARKLRDPPSVSAPGHCGDGPAAASDGLRPDSMPAQVPADARILEEAPGGG